MELSALAIFAFALLMTAGSPGPSIAALVARVLVRGWKDVAPFLGALWIGELIWLTLAVAGLATIAETFHLAFVIVKYCGIAYLLYLAWQMWRAPVSFASAGHAPEAGGPLRMFFAGLAITLGNPKAMVFYLALLPVIVDLEGITLADWVKLSGTMMAVLVVVDVGYVVLASRAREFLKSPAAIRLANRLGAGVMVGAATAIVTR